MPISVTFCLYTYKLLSPLLGTISNAHIKNSRLLLNQLTDIDMNNKYLACLDIKSLYTNIPVDKCIEHQHNHLRKSNSTFPLPISKLIKFVPYALHTATSNTTIYFINKNLVYQWDLLLAEFLHAFILNS